MAADAEAKLPPRWAEGLAQVEQALAAAIANADRREQALQKATAAVQPGAVDLTEGLARFRLRLRALADCAARAEQTVAASDASLADGEEELRTWFQKIEAVRRKLANWGGRL